MEIKIIKMPIAKKVLRQMAESQFGELIKAVVGVRQSITGLVSKLVLE